MPFGNIGITGLILILIIALIIFGPSKLPELGRAFGRTLSEFKGATRDLMAGDKEDAADKTEQYDQKIDEKNGSAPQLVSVKKK